MDECESDLRKELYWVCVNEK